MREGEPGKSPNPALLFLKAHKHLGSTWRLDGGGGGRVGNRVGGARGGSMAPARKTKTRFVKNAIQDHCKVEHKAI